MSMNLQELLSIVKRGWKVEIGLRRAADWTPDHRTYNAAMLANPQGRPEAHLALEAAEGQLITDNQLQEVCGFLSGMEQRVPADDPMGELVMAHLTVLDADGLPLPQPLRYAANDDGSSDIEDDQGTVLGHVDSNASIAERGDAVVAAVAVRAAAGLMLKPSKVLPAESAEMMDSALLSSAELEAMDAALQAMPPERRPVPAPRPDDRRKAERASLTARRQRQLLSDVKDALVDKGVVKVSETLQAETLKDLCTKNGHIFRYESVTPDPKIKRYLIVDDSEHLVAGGRLKTPVFMRDQGHYLPQSEVGKLLESVDSEAWINEARALALSIDSDLSRAEAEVDRFQETYPDGVEEHGDHTGEEGRHNEGNGPR